LYLFAKPKDPEAESYVWVRNSDFEDLDADKAGMANAFIVKNKYSENEFATEKPEQSKQWKEAIEKIRTLPRRKAEDSDDDGDKTPSSKRKMIEQKLKQQERPTKLSFEVRGIGLKFQDEYCKDWLGL